jgi:hypothetical protein
MGKQLHNIIGFSFGTTWVQWSLYSARLWSYGAGTGGEQLPHSARRDFHNDAEHDRNRPTGLQPK